MRMCFEECIQSVRDARCRVPLGYMYIQLCTLFCMLEAQETRTEMLTWCINVHHTNTYTYTTIL